MRGVVTSALAYDAKPGDVRISHDLVGCAFANADTKRSSLWRKAAAVVLGDDLVLFTAPDGGLMVMSCKFLLGSSWKRV